MKKALIIANDNLGIGGIQTVIMTIVRSFKEECRFDVVVFNHDFREYEHEFEQQGRIFTIKRISGARSFLKRLDFYIRPLTLFRKINKIIQDNGPYDIIHCHNFFEEGIALYSGHLNKIPIRIAHSHSCIPIPPGKVIRHIYHLFYRFLINRYSTHRVSCSSMAGLYLFGKRHTFQVIENAINSRDFRFVAGSSIAPWTFLHVGRWGGIKNQSFLLDVFYQLCLIHNDSVLTLVGYGDSAELEGLLQKANHLGIKDRIRILKSDSNIAQLMQNNNIFIFPSMFEGLGLVLIEAQATGMKCFASDTVPREADLGLVDFMNLNDGAVVWAKKISEYIMAKGSHRTKIKLGNYDIDKNIMLYRALYNL